MTNEQFSLCWDNFHTNMSSGLSSLLKSEDLVDVTLAVEGRYIKAHKMILSVCSPYFKELFQVNPCKHPIVFLKDVSYSVISSLLEFMYQGEVKVSQDILATFIKTAEALKIKGLTGDASNQLDPEPEATSTPVVQNNVTSTLPTDSSITLTRKTSREKTPPRKKMLGPASKRFKSDTDFSHSPQQTEQQSTENLQTDPQSSLANDSVMVKNPPPLAPLTTFKLEPEETAVSLANEEDITYDDSAMDDMGMDNTADYMMDSIDDSKPGTSSEVANAEVPGENQELVTFVQGPRRIPQLVIRQHLYVKHMGSMTGRSYWKCRQYDRGSCKARCAMRGMDISLSGLHNHLPEQEVIEQKRVLRLAVYNIRPGHDNWRRSEGVFLQTKLLVARYRR